MPAGPYNPALPVTGTDITTSGFGFPVVRAVRWWNGVPLSGDTERPQADIYQTVAQSIATSTTMAVLFDSEALDTANGHSTSTNTSRYTAPLTGWYNVIAQAGFAGNATGYRRAQLRVNGGTIWATALVGAVNGNETQVQLSRKIQMTAGDYVELVIFQNSGGALNTSAVGGSTCSMDIEMCRAQ